MKKIITLIISLFLVINLFAQEHLTFKNLPIEGTLNQFVAKLKASGYTLDEQFNGGVIMNGSFAGFDDCTIYVICSDITQTVWKVAVDLPTQHSWSSARSRYEDLREKLIDKYGNSTNKIEFFIDPYERGDGYELQAIALEKGYYITAWETDLGVITIEIDAESNSSGYVTLGYEDAKGVVLKRQEADQVILRDL